jgi:hypothetical protein
VDFNRVKPWERVESCIFFHIVLEVMYVGVSGEKSVYMGLLKEMHAHL